MMFRGGSKMRQLTRATRAYYGLILINFVALMYNASLYLLVTNYVLQRDPKHLLTTKTKCCPGKCSRDVLVDCYFIWCFSPAHFLSPQTPRKQALRITIAK